jgi:hypothetical protein
MVALLLAGTVSASIKKGDQELDALGGWTRISNGADTDALFLVGRYGYSITDMIQVGAVGAWASIDMGAGDIDIYGIGASVKFFFMTDKQWVPYAGVQGLWGSADFGGGSNDGFIYGALGGVRWEMTPTTDLFIEGEYNLTSGDLKDVVGLDSIILVMVGFVHQLK